MSNYQEDNGWFGNKKLIIFIGASITLIIIMLMIFWAVKMVNDNKKKQALRRAEEIRLIKEQESANKSSTTTASLPIGGLASSSIINNSINDWQAQNVSFGDFYSQQKEVLKLALPDYTLPQNVKIEVANYYDFSRKINLDAPLESLNAGGLAVIDNPFPAEAKNFYGMYAVLKNKQVPYLLTNDFLFYYYQNVLKTSFKDIEATVFYENLWLAGKRLYLIAKERYEKNLNDKGLVNDLALEGSRRELVFLTMILSLLSPAENQIEKDSSLSKNIGFTPSEASDFSFSAPAYLKNDVEKELALIRQAKEKIKSPVLLYERDYQDFIVPAEYKNNARLNNFYLASRWINSPFPLLYKNENCPDCLLDKDDWRLSMYSAFLLSEDLSANLDIQNRWAKIYKIKSFFEGLRGDLNYIHYNEAIKKLFGADKKVEEIFSANEKIDENLANLQSELLAINFAELEGGLDKNSTTTQKILGLKMLVDPYWPTNYIISSLAYPRVGDYFGDKKKALETPTACLIDKKENYSRCLGMAFDVLNVIYPFDKDLNNNYFSANTNYENYFEQSDKLNKQFSDFTVVSWHNNNYWTTLDMVKKMMDAPDDERPIFMKSVAWRKQDLNTAAGAWINLQLPPDIFVNYQENKTSGLNGNIVSGDGGQYNYIEPNLNLIREFKSNTTMVLEMLKVLKVGEQENSVLADLGVVKKNFEDIELIVKKELNSEKLTDEDYKFIEDFASAFLVQTEGKKVFNITSPYSKSYMQEKLEGVKLKIIIYYKEGKKYLLAGPVFNYWEVRK